MGGEIDPDSVLLILQYSLHLIYNIREVLAECLSTEQSYRRRYVLVHALQVGRLNENVLYGQ